VVHATQEEEEDSKIYIWRKETIELANEFKTL